MHLEPTGSSIVVDVEVNHSSVANGDPCSHAPMLSCSHGPSKFRRVSVKWRSVFWDHPWCPIAIGQRLRMQLLCHASHHGKHTKQGFCVISCLGAIKVKDVKDMDNQTVMIRAALVSHVMRIPKFSPWILHVLASSRVFAMVSARSPNVQVKAWSFETKTTSEMIHFNLIVLLQSLDHIGSSFFHVFTCHICSLRVFHVATKFQSCFNHVSIISILEADPKSTSKLCPADRRPCWSWRTWPTPSWSLEMLRWDFDKFHRSKW